MNENNGWFDDRIADTNHLINDTSDGIPVNVDPLTEIPASEMKLYAVRGFFIGQYFDTEEQFKNYISSHKVNPDDLGIVEYIRNCAGRSDVIKYTSISSGKFDLYSAVDEDGYSVYNKDRSFYKGEFVWEYTHGTLYKVYKAFRDRGIVFEYDMYTKMDEKNDKIRELLDAYISNKEKNNYRR